jgi:hypothetical protein
MMGCWGYVTVGALMQEGSGRGVGTGAVRQQRTAENPGAAQQPSSGRALWVQTQCPPRTPSTKRAASNGRSSTPGVETVQGPWKRTLLMQLQLQFEFQGPRPPNRHTLTQHGCCVVEQQMLAAAAR